VKTFSNIFIFHNISLLPDEIEVLKNAAKMEENQMSQSSPETSDFETPPATPEIVKKKTNFNSPKFVVKGKKIGLKIRKRGLVSTKNVAIF